MIYRIVYLNNSFDKFIFDEYIFIDLMMSIKRGSRYLK
jgi:hypothetical protein